MTDSSRAPVTLTPVDFDPFAGTDQAPRQIDQLASYIVGRAASWGMAVDLQSVTAYLIALPSIDHIDNRYVDAAIWEAARLIFASFLGRLSDASMPPVGATT